MSVERGLHVNDSVFQPNDDADTHRREPTLLKKLAAGNAVWSTYKELLGWVMDTLRGTIKLPPHERD